MYAAANAPIMNSQLPTLSSAPPVSAWPLVQPRASTAPTPMTRAAEECRGQSRRRATSAGRARSRSAVRPASHAESASADRDADDLEDQPVDPRATVGVDVAREERARLALGGSNRVADSRRRYSRTRPTRRALGP